MRPLTKQHEQTDPFEAVAVGISTAEDTTDEMARTFVEEFALLGFPPERVLRLFRNPFYAGAHMVLERRGDEFVRALIREVFGTDGEVERNG
jgi:hypothetical protein